VESMRRTLRLPERPRADGDGHLDAPRLPVRRRRRAGLALVSLLVAVITGLAFAVWARSLSGRADVLAAAHTVNAGDVITASDLRTVRVSSDSDVASVPAGQKSKLVGKVAATPLFKGTLVSRDQVSGSAPLGSDEAVVGVLVKPGQAPLASLRVGTSVQVVQTAGQNQFSSEPPQVLADGAVIYAVSTPTANATQSAVAGGLLVSLKVQQGQAAPIVSAADADRIRLVVVGGVTG
jgi:hypothetical protein